MKRFLINISLILIAFLIYLLQENFFNWFTIAGTMPNIFVILILFIGLFAGRNKGTIYGLIIGIVLDIYNRKPTRDKCGRSRASRISSRNI